jgi:hypothetical protein
MTETLTVSDADRGQEVATNKAIVSVVLKKAPLGYDPDYLAFADGNRVAFNMHISSTPVSVDSNLFSGAASFESLVVKEIPTGCEVELELTDPPTLTSLSPDTAVSGDLDFVLSCTGANFVSGTVIRFGPTYDEPTTLVSDTEVTTIVKPSLFAPAVVPVWVRTGNLWSDPVDFTFTEPAEE